jgi:hypothetical protein
MRKKPHPQIKRGPGRPISTGRGMTVTIYIARKDYETLVEIATDKKETVSAVIRDAIGQYIKK